MLTKSKIDYIKFAWNFYTGCLHTMEQCPCADKCWARGMAHRFGKSFEPTLHPEMLLDPLRHKQPARIGVCFTGDLFGEWVDPNQVVEPQVTIAQNHSYGTVGLLRQQVFQVINSCPQHTFLFLTKNPAKLREWGNFPKNAWVGVTVCNRKMMINALDVLEWQVKSSCKWLSIEPLMEPLVNEKDNKQSFSWCLTNSGIKWLVIGGFSGGKTQPKIEWVREIVEAADQAGIPVFLKNNLKPLLRANCSGKDKWALSKKAGNGELWRRELPEELNG